MTPMTAQMLHDVEGAAEDEELAPEAGQTGQAQRGERGDGEQAVVVGQLAAQARRTS